MLVLGQTNPVADLQTAMGVHHRLCPWTDLDTLWARSLAPMTSAVEDQLRHELPNKVLEQQTNPFAYFVEYLAPTFQNRDQSEGSYLAEPASTNVSHRID